MVTINFKSNESECTTMATLDQVFQSILLSEPSLAKIMRKFAPVLREEKVLNCVGLSFVVLDWLFCDLHILSFYVNLFSSPSHPSFSIRLLFKHHFCLMIFLSVMIE